jgi:hypothetical protein
MALMVASVPLDTMRTCSTEATRSTMASARRTSPGSGAVGRAADAASVMAAMTDGSAWPR